MAIAPDILLAFLIDPKDSTHKITIQNTNPRFPKREIEIDIHNPIEAVKIDSKTLGIDSINLSSNIEWSNYFKAGYLGHTAYIKHPPMPSMKILINGIVPTGSGLSSSAAMVVSSLISSLLSANATMLSKRKIVELAMISERNVGVNSGGMDQAASVFGEKEKAVFVEFSPELRGTTVKFPVEDIAFVIGNSLVNADKHDTAPENYNLRVVETTLAAEILAKRLELGELKSRDGFGGTLQEVVEKYFKGNKGKTEDQLEEFQKVILQVFKGEGEYTQSELAEMMGLSEKDLVEKYMTRFPGFSSLCVYLTCSTNENVQITKTYSTCPLRSTPCLSIPQPVGYSY
jgi:galactokinase